MIFGTISSAQSVRVDVGQGRQGQGIMVSDRNSCYLLLPAHVAGSSPFVTLTSEAPVRIGQAVVNRPFWTELGERGAPVRGLDLAIGAVRGDIASACTEPLSQVIPARIGLGLSGTLITIGRDGRPDGVQMTIVNTSYLTFEAKVTTPGAEMFPGRSGSFLFIDNRPAGMVIRAPNEGDSATFVRIEEILINAERWIGDQGAIFTSGIETASVQQSSGIAARLVSSSEPPISPEFPPELTLSPDGAFVTAPSRPLTLVYEILGDSPAISRVIVTSNPASPYGIPRDIAIQVDSTPNRTRPRAFWAGRMAQDGRADSGARSQATKARWVAITFKNAWAPGSISITQVLFE